MQIEQSQLIEASKVAPICGKPGRGFKAARTRDAKLAKVEEALNQVHKDIQNFETRNGKANMQARMSRHALIVEAEQAWDDFQKLPLIRR